MKDFLEKKLAGEKRELARITSGEIPGLPDVMAARIYLLEEILQEWRIFQLDKILRTK